MQPTAVNLPQDKKAATICREWAADFQHGPLKEEGTFWNQMADAFATGGRVDFQQFERLGRAAHEKIQVEAAARNLAPKHVLAGLAAITAEARYIWNLLETSYPD